MSWDIKGIQQWGWKKHPAGAVIKDPGNSRSFKTGVAHLSAYAMKKNAANVSSALFYCPDSAILIKNEKVVGIDYDFVKAAESVPQNVRLTLSKWLTNQNLINDVEV